LSQFALKTLPLPLLIKVRETGFHAYITHAQWPILQYSLGKQVSEFQTILGLLQQMMDVMVATAETLNHLQVAAVI